MDWFHCNKCFRQEGARFVVTSCGHVLCATCGAAGPCPVCGAACRHLPISPQMRPQEKLFFKSPAAIALKHLASITQVWRFQRAQAELLLASHRHATRRHRAAMEEAKRELGVKERELESLRRENTELRRAQLSPGWRGGSRSSTPRPVGVTSPAHTVTPQPRRQLSSQVVRPPLPLSPVTTSIFSPAPIYTPSHALTHHGGHVAVVTAAPRLRHFAFQDGAGGRGAGQGPAPFPFLPLWAHSAPGPGRGSPLASPLPPPEAAAATATARYPPPSQHHHPGLQAAPRCGACGRLLCHGWLFGGVAVSAEGAGDERTGGGRHHQLHLLSAGAGTAVLCVMPVALAACLGGHHHQAAGHHGVPLQGHGAQHGHHDLHLGQEGARPL